MLNYNQNLTSCNKGAALLLAIILVLLMVVIGGVLMLLSTSQFRLSKHQIDRSRASYFAEAGMQYALYQLRTGGYTPPVTDDPLDVDGDTTDDVWISVSAAGAGDPAGAKYKIQCKAKY